MFSMGFESGFLVFLGGDLIGVCCYGYVGWLLGIGVLILYNSYIYC